MNRIIVCGGREFVDRGYVFGVLDAFLDRLGHIDVLAHGDARGADTLAGDWADARNVPQRRFPVPAHEWQLYGKAAGVIRNKRMLAEVEPTLVVSFPGKSGTADMVSRALQANVIVLSFPGPPEEAHEEG